MSHRENEDRSASPIRLRSPEYHALVAELRQRAPGKTTLVTIVGGATAALRGAAQHLAAELGRRVHRIDTSAIISKYIGETEKNLDLLFSRAARANAVLLFDEADSLFGKRTDVKDSHDRYAALVRQRLDQYDGIAIVVSAGAASPPPTTSGHRKVRRVRLTWPPQ
jgi:SpoVK/Ycf46/Vps4 family AAA+-type ATPase